MTGVMHETHRPVVALTESEVTAALANRAASIKAMVVRGPLCEEMRKILSSAFTSATSGSALKVSVQPGGTLAKLTSRIFLPGIEAFNFNGESSATSFPWSTIAMRSHNLSASSI